MDGLAELYGLLQEEDMWAGLWTKKAKYPETNIAICYEQQGFYEQAQGAYELAMSKYRTDVATKPAPGSVMQEVRVWEAGMDIYSDNGIFYACPYGYM